MLRRVAGVSLLLFWVAISESVAQNAVPNPYYETAIADSATSITIAGESVDEPQTYYSESHALVIGEVNYTGGWDKLPLIPLEIKKLTKGLEHQRFKVEVHFDLKSADLINVIDGFMRKYGTIPDSRLVVYLSGHGYTRKRIKYKVGYFIPVDAGNPEVVEETQVAQRAIPLAMFAGWAQMPDPRHVLFIFDSCFSASFFGYEGDPSNVRLANPYSLSAQASEKAFPMDAAGNWIYKPSETDGVDLQSFALAQASKPARIFLAAGAGTDIAPASSVMTDLLSDILLGRNTEFTNLARWATFGDIGSYLVRETPPRISKKLGLKQVAFPVFRYLPDDNYYQEGSMVFFRDKTALSSLIEEKSVTENWNKVASSDFDVISVGLKEEKVAFDNVLLQYKTSLGPAEILPVVVPGTGLPGDFSQWTSLYADAGDPKLMKDAESRVNGIDTLLAIARVENRHPVRVPEAEAVLHASADLQAKIEDYGEAAGKFEGPAETDTEQTVIDSDTLEKYRVLTEQLLSRYADVRRPARLKLREALLAEEPNMRGRLIALLSQQLSKKTYRFQLGLGVALAGQSFDIPAQDAVLAVKELSQALSSAKQISPARGKELVDNISKALASVCRSAPDANQECG